MNKRRIAMLVATLLILGGVLLSIADVLGASVERRATGFDGPVDVQGQTLRLRESREVSGWRVDLLWGDNVVAERLPLTPDPRAPQTNYTQRYAGQLWLYAPKPVSRPWHLMVIDRTGSEPQYSRYVLDGAAPLETQRVTGDVATMRSDFHGQLLGQPAVGGIRLPVPPPALVLLGALILLLQPERRRGAVATVALVLAIAAAVSFVAWPVMLHLGPARSIPPALLALGITALVALGFGARWQAGLASSPSLARALRGMLVALFLLAVFTVSWVQINGFMAPIFRPPGAGLSPGEWFMQDMVAPSLAVGGLGLIPALLAGAVYGVLLRAR
ncbi:MAG: hypothetical protein AB8G16_02800 [Gammaproteobacteria bacterium]